MDTHRYLSNGKVPFPGKLNFLKVKDSPIQGKGLFTEIDLEAGRILFKLKGDKVCHEYDPGLSGQNPNWIGIGYGEWLRLAPGEISIYINHSCKPNIIIDQNLHVVLLAPVNAHEELLLDYSTTELDPFWQMECCCGESTCRKVLRAYPFMPYELRAMYNQYLAPVFSTMAEEVSVEKI